MGESVFDVVVCTFGIFFAMAMEAQLEHMFSKVKPGGTVLTNSFQENFFQPLRDLLFQRLSAYCIPEPPQAWKGVASEDACRQLFEQADLRNVQVVKENVIYYLKSEEKWWKIVWHVGFRQYVTELQQQDRERFRREHVAEVREAGPSKGSGWTRKCYVQGKEVADLEAEFQLVLALFWSRGPLLASARTHRTPIHTVVEAAWNWPM